MSMGVYVVDRAVLERVPPHVNTGSTISCGTCLPGRAVHVEPYGGYWLDIGRPDDYVRAIDEFEQHRRLFLPEMSKTVLVTGPGFHREAVERKAGAGGEYRDSLFERRRRHRILPAAGEGVNHVFHLAARTFVPDSWARRGLSID